ncbi:DUF6064 family protein [Azospirillum sp. ST 5-10]|uniref:DUF6064 family protein n=1 Tax=unclassified Azospirillum TaxID=2630922 RepID=UPI003F4A0B1B
MAAWWTYRPEDFLLFSERVYWRLFELHNAAVWPLPLLTLALGLAMALRPGRWAALALAALWAFVGWSFFWERYATVNWAASYVAPAFALEALLLAFVRPDPDRVGRLRRGVGNGLIALAVLGYPLLAPLLGRPWSGAELFGIAPDPTAVATLGLLLLTPGRVAATACAVPVLWCLASGATLSTMGAPLPWTAAVVAAALAVAATASRHRG